MTSPEVTGNDVTGNGALYRVDTLYQENGAVDTLYQENGAVDTLYQENGAQFIKAFISQRSMSNGFIYVVDAHFIDKIEEKKILDPSACVSNDH